MHSMEDRNQDTGKKKKTPSFRTKLWLYFAAFAAVIFSLLWILQTVFLQNFYDNMMKRNIREAAEKIASNADSPEIFDIIDRLSLEDSLLVYITDDDGDIIYSSDAYQPYFRQNSRQNFGPERENPSHRGEESGKQLWSSRSLPDNFDDFLESLAKDESGTVAYTFGNAYIFGTRIRFMEDDDDDDDREDAVLYVAGTLGAVGAAASIIRVQLLWVTGLSLVLAFIIAWLIARRFAAPVNQLNDQARMLSRDQYEDHFSRGFCRELDELNDSLSQSARELAAARDYQKELLANVSHDLRTPLTMIKGYAEMIRDISWEDETQREADCAVIIKEADRMTALVNEILEYSRLQEKDLEPVFSDVDLSRLTAETVERFRPLAQKSGVEIDRQIAPDCTVRGNRELLERALFNLIDNAVRHSAERDMPVTVTVSRDAGRVRLDVRDQGEGIDPQELPHIWEKYYTNRQRGNQGVSGLGLAIVKQIAGIHGAEVRAESQKGYGSTFSLIF